MNELVLHWYVWLKVRWDGFWRGPPPKWSLPPRSRELPKLSTVQRMQHARGVLDDPVFIEAVEAVEARLSAARKQVPLTNPQASHSLIMAEQSWRSMLAYFTNVIRTGEMEMAKEKKERKAQDAFAQSIRRGVRN